MKTYYFTYGSNHSDETGASLGTCFTPVEITDADLNESNGFNEEHAARQKMFAARDDKWSMCYASQEAAGVVKWNLAERSLASVAFDRLRLKRDLVARTLEEERKKLTAALSLCDKAAVIMELLPKEIIPSCIIHYDTSELLIFHLSREQVKEAMSALHAGRWEKRINPVNGTRLDYNAEINGVKIQIFSAPPPESCQIIEHEEEVPAHRKITRELICR